MSEENNIPKHWQIKTLGEVCLTTSGGTPSRGNKSYYEGNIPWVKSGELSKGLIIDTEEKISEEAIKNSSAKIFPKGTLLIALYGATIGKLAFLGVDAATNQAVCGIYKNDNIESNYLYYYLFSKKPSLVKQAIGGAQPNINQGILKNLKLPIAPLQEQQAIVAKIEELTSDLENGKQQLQLAQQQLKIYRQSLLKWAFEGKLTNKNVTDGELPKEWEKVQVKEVTEMNPKIPNRENISKQMEVQFLPMKLVEEIVNVVHLTEIRKYEDVLKGSYTPFINGDVIFAKVTPCMENGKIAIVDNLKNGIGFGSSEFHVIRASKSILSKYIFYYLVQDRFRNEAANEMTGAVGLRRVPKQFIENYSIPLPPVKEQQLIVDELESKLTVCNKIEETISQSLLQAESLRQSILKKAFEGKLAKTISLETNVGKTISLVFPKKNDKISTTDLHAGIIAMIIDAHEKNQKHLHKLNHVKCEKISHMIEYKLGISLGRCPVKDAAGPDDYPHLKKVEHRANKANWFGIKKLDIGNTYYSKPGIQNAITKIETAISNEDLIKINELIHTFLPFEMEHAELIATLYAGWNNLLIQGLIPSDEDIVFESRENWSDRKLTIEREKFFKTLSWMKTHGYIPEGNGNMVLKGEKVKLPAKKKNIKINL